MIKYPLGLKKPSTPKSYTISNANRGVFLENIINTSLVYYEEQGLAYILKRPTPIKIIKVDYSKEMITEAYFEKESTVDYSGIYKKRFICFEAKSHLGKNAFPLANIPRHQINYLTKMVTQDAIAFFIIELRAYNEYYLLDVEYILNYEATHRRKSIILADIIKNGFLIQQKIKPRLAIIEAVEELLKTK